MNNLSKFRPFSLTEAKIQAQILLKNLRSSDSNVIKQTQSQLSVLMSLNNSIDLSQVQLKHTLAVIAKEHGFNTWSNLKNYFTLTGLTRFEPSGGFFNQWFSNYKDAKAILIAGNNYLLPYKNQFFICEAGYINHIGLDPTSSNWQEIGYNWVEPSTMSAWQRLNLVYLARRSK